MVDAPDAYGNARTSRTFRRPSRHFCEGVTAPRRRESCPPLPTASSFACPGDNKSHPLARGWPSVRNLGRDSYTMVTPPLVWPRSTAHVGEAERQDTNAGIPRFVPMAVASRRASSCRAITSHSITSCYTVARLSGVPFYSGPCDTVSGTNPLAIRCVLRSSTRTRSCHFPACVGVPSIWPVLSNWSPGGSRPMADQ